MIGTHVLFHMFTSFYHFCRCHCLRTGFRPFCWFCVKTVWLMYPMHSSSSNKANIWQRGQSMFYLYCFLYWWDYHVILAQTGARFTNDFLPAIQIRWKLRLALIPLLAIRSQQIFAHATTAQLSCHVQNFVAITVLESRWERNVISIEFELRWKNR